MSPASKQEMMKYIEYDITHKGLVFYSILGNGFKISGCGCLRKYNGIDNYYEFYDEDEKFYCPVMQFHIDNVTGWSMTSELSLCIDVWTKKDKIVMEPGSLGVDNL